MYTYIYIRDGIFNFTVFRGLNYLELYDFDLHFDLSISVTSEKGRVYFRYNFCKLYSAGKFVRGNYVYSVIFPPPTCLSFHSASIITSPRHVN